MAADPPSPNELRRGMTVRVVQEQDGQPDAPILGDVAAVLDEGDAPPGGPKVRLQSGAVGRVKEVVHDE
jgi:uncharacterized repeat protein (TIGR03833 family)